MPRALSPAAAAQSTAAATDDARNFEQFLTPSLHGFGTSVFSEVLAATIGAFQSISWNFKQREAWRSSPAISAMGISPASHRPASK